MSIDSLVIDKHIKDESIKNRKIKENTKVISVFEVMEKRKQELDTLI